MQATRKALTSPKAQENFLRKHSFHEDFTDPSLRIYTYYGKYFIEQVTSKVFSFEDISTGEDRRGTLAKMERALLAALLYIRGTNTHVMATNFDKWELWQKVDTSPIPGFSTFEEAEAWANSHDYIITGAGPRKPEKANTRPSITPVKYTPAQLHALGMMGYESLLDIDSSTGRAMSNWSHEKPVSKKLVQWLVDNKFAIHYNGMLKGTKKATSVYFSLEKV